MQEVIEIKEHLNNFFLLLIHMKLISFTHVVFQLKDIQMTMCY